MLEAMSKTDWMGDIFLVGANAKVAVFGGDEVAKMKNISCVEPDFSNMAGG